MRSFVAWAACLWLFATPMSSVLAGVGTDCNGNAVADSLDIADGTSADCNANDVPDECELGTSQCPDATQCIFGGGVVKALGQVQLALEELPDGNVLRLLGVGSTGDDGVRYGLQSGLTKELHFETPNLAGAGQGAMLRFEQELATEAGEALASLTILHQGDVLRFRVALNGEALVGFRLLIFQGDALVTDVDSLPGGEFLTAPIDLISFACDLGCAIGLLDGVPCVPGENCPTEACLPGLKISGRFATQTLIALPQSGGVVGDRFILQALDAAPAAPGRGDLTLRAANTGDLGLLADDLVHVLPDCNQNGIIDACELDAGFSQDCDGNGVPDACDIADGRLRDCDENGAADACQIVAGTADDCNQNGVPDVCDLTSGAAPDCNENDIPDSCELDAGLVADCDGNGIPDGCDLASGGADCNENGVLDTCELSAELDCDASGVLDSCELRGGDLDDCDENGVPDTCELSAVLDCDGNGALDSCDLAAGAADCNANEVLDSCDLSNGGDCNSNGVLDTCEVFDEVAKDCNGNGLPDGCDILSDRSVDCNRNGVPDDCEVQRGAVDCDGNGVPDVCDLTGGEVSDCDQNGSPDSCDLATGEALDCNGNRRPDACDLASGAALDCNKNGVPDSCDLASVASADCNQNAIPDECDLSAGTSRDTDGDGKPDECDFNEVPVAVAYQAALVSAQQLKANGLIPQATLDFLIGQESDLSSKRDDLVEALRVVDFRETGSIDAAGGGGDGGGAAGGVVSGSTWLAISATGLVVGRMRVDISWNNNREFCSSVVGGHTFVGGVIGGNCQSAQIGALFTDACVTTRDCAEVGVQCGTYQMQCQQAIGSITINFNTPLETICAACAEIPWQLPGDCNQDGSIDIGDATCLFGFLFLGSPELLPCGDGGSASEANKALIDWNADDFIDMSDGVASLTWLFNQSASGGGLPHALGTSCVIIANCPQGCSP